MKMGSKPLNLAEYNLTANGTERKAFNKADYMRQPGDNRPFNSKYSTHNPQSRIYSQSQKNPESRQKKQKFKKMLAPKMQKGGYVRTKNLDLSYKPPNYKAKKLNVKYDLCMILRTINLCHAFDSDAACWVLEICEKNKSRL